MTSQLQHDYNDFVSNLFWACRSFERAVFKLRLDDDEALDYVKENPCGGWILSDFDTFHECPHCYAGQRHPEDDSPEVYDHPVLPPVYSHPVHQPKPDFDDLPF